MSTLMECSFFKELTLVSRRKAFLLFFPMDENTIQISYDQMRSGILWEQCEEEDVWEVVACISLFTSSSHLRFPHISSYC